MHEEGRASVDIGLQQPHAFVRGIPTGDHDVVQLVTQKGIYYGFVFAIDFEEVSERAHRGQAATQGIGLEQLAHGVGGVAVLADERLQGVAASGQGCHLGAQAIAFELGCTLFTAPRSRSPRAG